MLNIAICDDDIFFVKQIEQITKEYIENKTDSQCNISVFTDGMDLLRSKVVYDLLLLDIDMPAISGFALVNELNVGNNTTVIYISSHEHLVFESFRYSPLRFVRKSNLVTDLEEALSAYLNFYKSRSSQYMFSTFDGKKLMSISEIMYIEVYSHKLNIHTNNSKITANGNLKDIEHEFIKEGFIKTHQSFIVNYRFINFIKRTDVILDNGKKLPISRGKYEYVKEQYMKLSREM